MENPKLWTRLPQSGSSSLSCYLGRINLVLELYVFGRISMTFPPTYPPFDEALRNHLLRAPTAANQIRCKLFLSSLLRQHISKPLFTAGETVSYAYMAKKFLISRRILYIRIFQVCVKSRVQTRPSRHSPLYGDGDLQVTPSRKWAASRETDDGATSFGPLHRASL
jgi:hypothetical protein